MIELSRGWQWQALRGVALAAALGTASAALGQIAAPLAALLPADDKKTVEDFQQSVKNYLQLQSHAPSDAKLKQTKDVEDIVKRREALKKTIRAARPNAKQGDLFTPGISHLVRTLLAGAMNGPGGDKPKASLQHAEPAAAQNTLKLRINGDYPNKLGQPLQSTPSTLLQNLPELPKGMDYRLVGKTLVLRDAEANLVVDYLPNALP